MISPTARLPASVLPFRERLFGLTIKPERLHEIREERRPGSRYAQLDNCRHEVREAEHLMQQRRHPDARHDVEVDRGNRDDDPAPREARAPHILTTTRRSVRHGCGAAPAPLALTPSAVRRVVEPLRRASPPLLRPHSAIRCPAPSGSSRADRQSPAAFRTGHRLRCRSQSLRVPRRSVAWRSVVPVTTVATIRPPAARKAVAQPARSTSSTMRRQEMRALPRAQRLRRPGERAMARQHDLVDSRRSRRADHRSDVSRILDVFEHQAEVAGRRSCGARRGNDGQCADLGRQRCDLGEHRTRDGERSR